MMKGAAIGGVYTVAPDDNGSPINVSCEIMSEQSWLVRIFDNICKSDSSGNYHDI